MKNVTLHVSRSKQSTWEHTSADTKPNPTVYAYRYTPYNGRVRNKTGEGYDITIKLKPQGKGDFRIVNVLFPIDPFKQLKLMSNNGQEAVVRNTNAVVQQGYYNVVVSDGRGPAFECDPMISNLPRT